MTARPSVRVGAVCLRGDELLLVRRGHGPAAGTWDLPGDLVDADELLAETVVRVMAAQTGLEVLCGPFIGWTESLDDDGHELHMYFEAIVLGDQPSDSQPSDSQRSGDQLPDAEPTVAEQRSVPTWDVCELRLADGLAEFLSDHDIVDTMV